MGLLLCQSLRHAGRPVLLHAHANGINLIRLVIGRNGSHGLHGRVEQMNKVRKGITKKARNAQRDIYARTVEYRHGQHLDIHHPVAGLRPFGPHAHQRKSLGHVFARGAHGAGAPHRQAHGLRPAAMVLQMPINQALGRLLPHGISGRGRHGTCINRIEIAASGQHIGPPA